MDAAVAIESAAANKSKSNSSNSLHKSHLNSNSSGDFSPLMSLSTSLPPSSQSSMPTTPSLMSPQKLKKSGATKVPYSKSKSYSSSKIASINNNNAQQALWSTDLDDLVNNNTIITTSDSNANNGESCFDSSSPYQTSSTPASPQCHTPFNSPLLTPPIINSSTEFTSKKGLKKSKSSILMFSMSAASRQLSNEEQSVSSNTSPKIKGQKDKKKLLNMLLSKKIKVGSNSNSRIRQQLMLNHSFDSARILPIYDMSAISAAQTATTTTSSTSGQTKQHHHHHHQPLSSASHSQSAANLLSTSTSHPHQPSSISPKAASSSTASETASTTTGSIGTSTTNSSATNSITEGANNGATTATTTITTVNPNHDSSSSSSSVTAAAPYHPPSISNGSTNGSTSTHKQTNGSSSISGSNNNGNMSGYLFKWTNYLKGYQKRWIFLNNGFLSYYRSPNEMDHTCRGAINLANAHIQQNDDGVSFVVSNGGNQTFHLRAANDQERQKWISALETAKNKAPRPYHHGGAQQHPSSYINGIPSGKVGGGGGSSSSNAGGDLSDDDDENGAASTDAERNELESFLQVLQHKLNELSLSHEFVLKHSNMLTKSLTELENIQSKPDETAIKTINERSTIYKVAMNGVLNNCQEFINLAQFHTRKMHKILQSEHEIRLRLEDMVQEMAKQHLNIETQLSKRGKRIMAKGTPTTTNQSVSNKSQPSGGGVGGGTIKGGGQQQQSTNNQQQQSAQQSSSQHQQKPSQETKSSAAAGSNVGAGNVNSNEEDEDETYVANDDEFHDAVEDVTQFSVTLPRGKGLHQRNPSNISKLYLQESDDDEDEYDNSENDDGRATTIKVTMHSAATSADEAKTAPTTTTTSSAPTATAHATDKTISNGGALVKKKPSQMDLAVTKRGPPRQRRTQITPRPNYSINLWSIMKNCIGKDLSKIPIPVNFSEPISMLQRITEELEYAQLLDQAADCEDQWEQMALVAAFTVTSYSTTATRTNKPFNPLLGETFEFDRSDDLGWRSISEQVGHHPPGFAFHAESVKDWAFYQEFTMSSKFRGQYLQVVPLGTSHLEFKKSGHHYTWRKVSTFVRNIIVGKLWIDNVGEMDIINHKTKDVCHLKYFPYSYFSREPPRKVTGIITDANNVARYVLNGTWTEQIEGAPVLNPQVVTTSSTQLTTGKSKILWKRKYPPPYLETMYNFTDFAVQLNEPEDGVAPTDSRRRPDQRLMEEARWDEANQEKLRLEEKQRTNRKAREAAAAAAAAAATANMPNSIDPPPSSSLSSSTTNNNNNDENDDEDIEKMMRRQATHKSNEPEATWFKRVIDPYTNLPIHVFKNEYWECKAKQDWSRCPDLF